MFLFVFVFEFHSSGEERLKQSGLEKYFGARLGSRQATKPCLGSLEPH
jgi:hypothetical protein